MPAVTELPTELLALSPEQEEIIRLCRRFAAEEIRPIARAVDEADVEVPWEKCAQGGPPRADLLHAARTPRRGRPHRRPHPGPRARGAVRGQSRHRQPAHVERLLCPPRSSSWARPSSKSASSPLSPRPSRPSPLSPSRSPDTGSDAASLTTRAVRTPTGYRLTGRKAWISNGGVARVLRDLRHHRPEPAGAGR